MHTNFRKSAKAFAVRLMENLVVATFVLDGDGMVIIWNKACERLTGVAASEVLGTNDHWRAFYEKPRACLADLVVQGRTKELPEMYATGTIHGDSTHGLHAENWCVMPRLGNRRYLAVDAGPIYDEDGTLIAVVETLRDITEQKLAQMALENIASTDGLTGLANRRTFDKTLETEWRRARREQAPLSLLMADIDHFKAFNDTYGHQMGDECLNKVAQALGAQASRPADLAARYGGEEFVVLLPTTTSDGAMQVAERVRHAVSALKIPHGGTEGASWVTLSLGAATIVPTADLSPQALVRIADEALYAAKRAGRNRVSSAPLPAFPDGASP